MDRIYHHYENWECFKNGFFNNVSGKEKEIKKQSVIDFFTDKDLVKKYMDLVIEKWTYSCEHNLTNMGLNRVAWLGQSACCIYNSIPYKITMEQWRFIPEIDRVKACEIAEELIKEYEFNFNKRQLCLKLI